MSSPVNCIHDWYISDANIDEGVLHWRVWWCVWCGCLKFGTKIFVPGPHQNSDKPESIELEEDEDHE